MEDRAEIRLPKHIFAVAAADAIENATQHKVLELALRRQCHPLAAARRIHHPFELRIDCNLSGLWSGGRDLEAKHVTASSPVANVYRGHLAIVLELALGRDAFDENNLLAE